MDTMRDKWTDERLDDLNGRITDGFNRIDADLREQRRTIVAAVITLSAAMLAGFGGLAGLIATQL